MFTGENIEVIHIRIFGCPVYVHVPKDKRSKLDPSSKKGIFVRYMETSKAYIFYILGHRWIETSIDVNFDEDVAFNRSRHNHTDDVHDEEPVAPKVTNTNARTNVVPEEHVLEEHHDVVEPQRPAEMAANKRRLAWAHGIIHDAEKYGSRDGFFREINKM
jgi:hypothetical protein